MAVQQSTSSMTCSKSVAPWIEQIPGSYEETA